MRHGPVVKAITGSKSTHKTTIVIRICWLLTFIIIKRHSGYTQAYSSLQFSGLDVSPSYRIPQPMPVCQVYNNWGSGSVWSRKILFLIWLLRHFYCPWLRVRYNRNNCDYTLGRTIIPKDPIGCGCSLLCICLKNFLSMRALQAHIFMGLEAIMPRIHY